MNCPYCAEIIPDDVQFLPQVRHANGHSPPYVWLRPLSPTSSSGFRTAHQRQSYW